MNIFELLTCMTPQTLAHMMIDLANSTLSGDEIAEEMIAAVADAGAAMIGEAEFTILVARTMGAVA